MKMEVHASTQTIDWLNDRNSEQSLILKPPYQRKPVWTTKQKAYLIDTILKKYHIPELYIHRETNPGGKTIYNVVDGQQRIRSILDFINGDFSLLDEFTAEYADYDFNDLPDTVKTEFWGYTLYTRVISDATEDDVKNLFKRMNRYVVPLNAQELRHATYSGDFIKLMEEIAEDEFWAENKIVNPNEIRRMRDVEFVSLLFISMINGIQDKTKELDSYYTNYEVSFPDKAKWRKHFDEILNIITGIFPDIRNQRWCNKSDFYTLFMVIREILSEEKYIPGDQYEKVRVDLSDFSYKVTAALKKDAKGSFAKNIRDYANAIKKSTTDKDRRVTRHKIVRKILSKYLKKRD